MDPIGQPIEVLHVDDQPDFADLTAMHLERVDDELRVETARSAGDGLECLAANAVDCVVSDYDMPGRDGIEFLEAVREENPDLPFILFTGKGSEEVASEAISAGVTDYLQKEVGTDQYAILANRIRNAVGRARAEHERRRHLEAIETAQEGISILDEAGRFIYVNEAYAALYDYDSTELLGEHWSLLYPDADVDRIEEEILPRVRETGTWHGETTGLRADGHTFLEEHTLARAESGELICSVRDATDRREHERRFEAVFDNTYTFMGLLAPDGTIEEANETIRAFAGLDREALLGEVVWETPLFATDDAPVARQAVEQAAAGDLFRDEIRLQGADGTAIVDFSIRPVTDDDGTVTLLIAEGRDVTQKKRSLRRLETLVENLPGMVYRCHDEPGWPMEEVRGDVTSLTGFDASELESRGGIWGERIVHPDDRADVREAVRTAVADGEPFEITYRIRTKSGETRWVRERGQQIDWPGGPADLLEGFITDVTQSRETTAQLREERAFVDQALDALEEVFYVVDTDGHVLRWNRRLAAVSGYDSQEIQGTNVLEFFPADQHDRITTAMDETLATGESTIAADVVTAGGERVPFEFTGSRLTDADGEVIGLVGIGRRRDDHPE